MTTACCVERRVRTRRPNGRATKPVGVGERESVIPGAVLVIEDVFVDRAVSATSVKTDASIDLVQGMIIRYTAAGSKGNICLLGYFIAFTTNVPFTPGCRVVRRVDISDDVRSVNIEQPPLG